MARGKLRMKLIENEKTRAATLKKRMKGLKKKAYEFSILCDVKVCMIIFESKLKDSIAKIEVWPSDPVQVKSIIESYKLKVASEVRRKTFSVCDFFNIRNRQVQDVVAQVRRANFKAKFPIWDDRINDLSPEELASLLTKLDLNLEVVKRKIVMMKGDDRDRFMQSAKSRILGGFNTQSRPNPYDNFIPAADFVPKNSNHSYNDHIQAHVALKKLDFGVIRQQPAVPADEALVKLSLSLNPIENSMNPIGESLRMSMMNHLDFRLQSEHASSSSNIRNKVLYNPPTSLSVCYDPRIPMPDNVKLNSLTIPVLHHDPRTAMAMQNNLMFKKPRSFETRFYIPSMQPEAAYSQQQLMMLPRFPQMQDPSHHFTDFLPPSH